MNKDPLVIGIDLATAEVRCRCMSISGAQIAVTSASLSPVNYAQGAIAEQDASSWWTATKCALGSLMQRLGRARADVIALAVSATSGTVLLVDSKGRPLSNALMYNDARATAEAKRAQAGDSQRWAALGLSIQANFSLAKMGWLASHICIPKGARFCHASDFLMWQLAGCAPPTDWSHALKSGFDPLRDEWAFGALETLQIDRTWLPSVRSPTASVGRLCGEIADELNLPRSVELILGMTDGCAAQIACGAAVPGNFVSVLGTTLVLKGVSSELLCDPSGVVYSHRHPDGYWLPGGASNTGSEAFAPASAESLANLDYEATMNGPSSVVCYPLRRTGERFPFLRPDAEGFTLGTPHNRGDLHRARLEGVAFCERLGYHRLASIGAEISGEIVTTGGGSRSRIWSEIRASVLGRPVLSLSQADTSMGACMLAASGAMHRGLADTAADMSPKGVLVEPQSDLMSPSTERFGDFVESLHARGWIDQDLAKRASSHLD